MTVSRFGVAAGALVALAWLAYAVPQVGHHGLAIDSPSLFYAGDRTLFWLEHPGHPEALDFTWPAREPAGFTTAFFPFPDKNDPVHYPVLAGLAGALSAQLSAPLGVDPVDGHHLGLVFLHAIGLFFFTVLAVRLFGRRAGAFAGVALLFFPEAVGQAFNNAKDWPCADFYACAMLSGLEAFVIRRPGAARTTGLFAGVALSCKLNGAFACASLGLLAIGAVVQRSRARGRFDGSALADLALVYVLASAIFFLAWPVLYNGPIATWPSHVWGYLDWYLAYGKSPRDTWTDYPFRSLIYGTPLLVLAAAMASGFALRRARREVQWMCAFVLFWIALPLLRSSVPHSNFYDGNRHFLEYIPGLCVLAGLGAAFAWERLEAAIVRLDPRTWTAARLGVAALVAALLLSPVLRYRPFEATFFNALVGGLGGAQSRALFDMPLPHDVRVRGTEGDYWYGGLGDGLPHLKSLLADGALAAGRGFALCGPAPQQVQMMWPAGRAALRQRPGPADLVYAAPREVFCGLGLVRTLESQRPVLYRAERGGGLEYEILGAADGAFHPVVTSPSRYEADRRNFGNL